MWEGILHRFLHLERIDYLFYEKAEDLDAIDPFVLVFSQPSERGFVCPRLQNLRLPKKVLSQGSSAALLKRTLEERGAHGMRLKWMGFSGETTDDDWLLLEPFCDLVDEVG